MVRSSKRERVLSAVQGHEPDRIPVSFWYHFPLEHPSGEPLAEVELAFARKYDPDFLKVMHDLHLDLPDGLKKIEDPADWARLRPLEPRSGNFAEQLKALRIMRKELGPDALIIDTIFDPYAAANYLCDKKIMEHYRANPEAVKHGLQSIAVSLAEYTTAWIEEGGDGIFYALGSAQKSVVPEDEYREVFMPLDRLILETAMETGTFNFLHLHGSDLYFDLVHELPTHVLNWSSQITPPSLFDARKIHDGCIAGGVNEIDFATKTPAQIKEQVLKAVAEAGSSGFILTPGCSIPTDSPEELILAMRHAVGE